MASYQVKVDLIFGEKGIVRGALRIFVKLLVDRFRQMEPLMRPLAPGNAPFWPDSSV